jgi:hypothetical protein
LGHDTQGASLVRSYCASVVRKNLMSAKPDTSRSLGEAGQTSAKDPLLALGHQCR